MEIVIALVVIALLSLIGWQRAEIKRLNNIIWHHHELGAIERAYRQGFGECQVCKEQHWQK